MLATALRGACPGLQSLADCGLRAAAAALASGSLCSGSRSVTQFALDGATAISQGPGGRSSASGITATVFGGYGFIGSYVVNELGKRGSQVVVPTRTDENKIQHIKQMGDLGQIVLFPQNPEHFDIRDEAMVRKAISRSNVVINLVGQRAETMNFKYEDTHVEWPKRLARLCAEAGHVQRLVHFSDIGASENHASRRMRTKAQGDKALLSIFPTATIMKPAPVVGIEDYFFNHIVYQVSYSIIAPLVDNGASRVQPTYVLDVAEAVTKALQTRDTMGKTYHLAGPEVLTYREVYDTIISTLRLKTDDTIPVPSWMAKWMFASRDWARRMLPPLPMSNWTFSADYVEEIKTGKVAPFGSLGYQDLGITPTKVTEGLPIEPVRHYRAGGYSWGDMATLSKNVPESIRNYYNIKQ